MEWIEAVVHTTTGGSDLVSDLLMRCGAMGTQVTDRADVDEPQTGEQSAGSCSTRNCCEQDARGRAGDGLVFAGEHRQAERSWRSSWRS